MRLSDVFARGLVFASLIQILLDMVCLGLSAAVGLDTLLRRALLALSGLNIFLTMLMIGESGNRRFSLYLQRINCRWSLQNCDYPCSFTCRLLNTIHLAIKTKTPTNSTIPL